MSSRRDLPAAAIVIAAAALGVSLLAGGWGHYEQAPLPYVWRDVALVHFLAALPLAMLLGRTVLGRYAAVGRLAFAAGAMLLSLLLMLLEPATTWPAAALLRAAPAFGLALAAALCLGAGQKTSPAQPLSPGLAAFAAAILFLVPLVYVQAREKHDLKRLAELVGQSRVGEARLLASRIRWLAPQARFEGHSIGEAVAELDRVAADLAARAALPLPPTASDEERFDRARDLDFLGRSDEALAVVGSSPTLADSPEANLLRGAVHETRRQWPAALAAYALARDALTSRPRGPSTDQYLAQAITGVALCERKLGHPAAAEAAYQDLLALGPTADTHFLLAQFYEDTQQAYKADTHAREAMRLAPDRYAAPAQALLEKLRTTHFSCWGIGAGPQQ